MTSLRPFEPELPTSQAPIAYEGLPCGCVAGVYLAASTVLEVEFVEAKGPHCPVRGHRTGQLVGVAALTDAQQN